MYWREDRPSLDFMRRKQVADAVAIFGVPRKNGDHPVTVAGAGCCDLKIHGEILKKVPIAQGYGAFPVDEEIHAFELRDANGGGDVCHAVVVPDNVMPILSLGNEALPLEMSCPFNKAVVIRHDHSAFAGRYGFVAEEAESADVADRSDVATVSGGSDRLGTIFDNGDSMLICKRAK